MSLHPTEYAEPGVHEVELTIGGEPRTYSLLVPSSYDGTAHTPLVLAFHGFTMNPNQMVFGAWGGLAEEYGFLLAAPRGLQNRWAVANDQAEADAALPNSAVDLTEFPMGDRDVALAAAVLADVGEYLLVDEDRIFVTGVSLGGFMASRVACEIGEHFAALGPSLNSLLYSDPCPTQQKLAVVSVGHRNDATHSVTDAESAAAKWAQHNGCSDQPARSSPEGRVAELSFDACPDETPVRIYVHELSWAGDAGERKLWEFFASLRDE